MKAKVVLGVALVLIEFSIITRSQNSSLSSALEAPPTTTPLSKELAGAVDEASTTSVGETSEAPQVVTNETTPSIKVASEFTTTTVDITTIEAATAAEDFKLPENCSAYKVCRHRLLRNIFDSINHQHVFAVLSSSKTSRV